MIAEQDPSSITYKVPDPLEVRSPSDLYLFEFDGKGRELAWTMIKTLPLIVITLGLYFPWAQTKVRRYLWSHLKFSDEPLEYTGTGFELLVKDLVMLAVIFAASLLLSLVHPYLPPVANVIVSVGVLLILVPVLSFYYLQYCLSRSQWRGAHLGLDDFKGHMLSYLWNLGLLIVTLGFYGPWFDHNVQKSFKDRMYFGNLGLEYDGKATRLISRYALLMALAPPTLGLYTFWFIAWRMRYRSRHTIIGKSRLRMKVKGVDVLELCLFCVLATVFTLGLAIPWVLVYIFDFFAYRTAVVGKIDFEALKGGLDETSLDREGEVSFDEEPSRTDRIDDAEFGSDSSTDADLKALLAEDDEGS